MPNEEAPPYFSKQEFEARLDAVRRAMAARGLAVFIVSAPENIFYLTGLDHWGYFAPHMLLVPAEGQPVLVTRSMEKVTVATQVANARFEGHRDDETAADAVCRILLGEWHHIEPRFGVEAWSSGLPLGLAEHLKQKVRNAEWLDVSGVIDDIRMVKSPAEQSFIRRAAMISDAGAKAAIERIRIGESERNIAAACESAMLEAGGTFPGFGPFIRSSGRLGEEHTSWTSRRIEEGDAVFLELSGCFARYHAPLGRLVHLERAPPGTCEMARICADAFEALVAALRKGAPFRDVYSAWQGIVDGAGLSHYRRHHCGYVVGIGIPPSWTGGNKVTGLRADSDLILETGMCFHVLSWLMGTGRGDFFLSNTVLLGENGAEILTRTPIDVVAH
ncbi:MAG: aminopeptidase P family protein [Hyphomicrobiales bacterium]|nr:aminopeptidase P family protein [Hyphomicrobiales bacterium]